MYLEHPEMPFMEWTPSTWLNIEIIQRAIFCIVAIAVRRLCVLWFRELLTVNTGTASSNCETV